MLVNSCYVSRGTVVKMFQTAKVTFKVIQWYWQRCHSIGHIQFPISVPLQLCLISCTINKISLISQNLNMLHGPSYIPIGVIYHASASTPVYQSANEI